ncbi:MAG: OmpA family protein [Pirellulales bacterium]|jgi:flagellar motor protein MotB|nr:OmpA family protein [Thermoguttaceae bacterium]MDD4789303.1 OmpA family protein [Pirellulales bacterium]MDI9443447.1 OmpA family protein [Planctomycetota bacterium]NLZ00379.1 OmpA family protein [Pirellulaceae bacterium]
MGRRRPTHCIALLLALAALAAGCADSSMVLKGNVGQLQQQQLAMQRQNQQLQGRVASLDQNNQELSALVAQLRQQTKVAQDEATLLRNQLSTAASQLARLREEKKAADQQTEALTASLRRQQGVTIKPNNSLLAAIPSVNLRGVEARRDGDVIRIELSADQLFQHGTNQFLPNAGHLITATAEEILRTYPHQMIGIEGHTDSDPVQNYQFRNNTQLSTAQAAAVHDVLLSQTRIRPEQVFIVGHGGNHPLVSNATAAGKQRNRRVELVIYPERTS